MFNFRLLTMSVWQRDAGAMLFTALRSCSHYNRADPTVPQRAIVSENRRRTREEGVSMSVQWAHARRTLINARHRGVTSKNGVPRVAQLAVDAEVRRRRSPTSPRAARRSTWWSREARGRANVNITSSHTARSYVLRARGYVGGRVDACTCVYFRCNMRRRVSSGGARRRGDLRRSDSIGATGLTNRRTPFIRKCFWRGAIRLSSVIIEEFVDVFD